MKKGWTTTKLIAAGSLGVLHLLANLPGSSIAAMTGIPLSGGIFNLFIGGVFYSITCLIINQFGAATVMIFTFAILALPLPIVGTPGFFPKLLALPLIGLLVDMIFRYTKKNKKAAAALAGGVSQTLSALFVVVAGSFFNIPGIEKTVKIFSSPFFFVGFFMAGCFAGYIGYLIYRKIENTSVIKRIQGV